MKKSDLEFASHLLKGAMKTNECAADATNLVRYCLGLMHTGCDADQIMKQISKPSEMKCRMNGCSSAAHCLRGIQAWKAH